MPALDLIAPFWKTKTMDGESLLLVQAQPDHWPAGRLIFTPTRIISVRSADGTRTFEPGRDYRWQAGTPTLHIPPTSHIPVLPEAKLYPPRGSQKYGTCRNRETDLLFGEGADFHNLQIAVGYEHQLDGWQMPATLTAVTSLPRLTERLARRQALSMVLLGDSISVGENASGLAHVQPLQPGYGQLVAEAIGAQFKADIRFKNLSLGGASSSWGVDQIPAVAREKPDLVLLAFGMNDASAQVAPEQFAINIKRQMETLHAACPEAEFILVAPMTGNPQWTGTHDLFYPAYRDMLWQLRGDGIAVADVTTLWLQLLERKNYLDLTGNGLNHPNDFGHRLYAQVVWSVLQRSLPQTPVATFQEQLP